MSATEPPPRGAGESGDGAEKEYVYVVGGRNRGRTVAVVERYSVSEGHWERCTSMRTSRGSHGVALIGGQVCAVAGGGINSNLSSCEIYDDQRNVWCELAELNTPRHALACASGDGALYAVGGWVNGNFCSGETERYDATQKRWVTCSAMQVPRRLHGTAVLNGKLYAFGGIDDNNTTPLRVRPVDPRHSAECYDPEKEQWSLISPLPRVGDSKAGGCVSCCAVGAAVYVFVWGQRLLRYSPASDSYEKVSTLPLKEWYGFAVTTLGEDIYVVGGSSQGAWTGAMFVFHTTSGDWEELPKMKIVRRRCGAAACAHPPTTCPLSVPLSKTAAEPLKEEQPPKVVEERMCQGDSKATAEDGVGGDEEQLCCVEAMFGPLSLWLRSLREKGRG